MLGKRCFAQHQVWVLRWENGFLRDGGKAKRIFCCPHGVWAGLCGVWETCNGPGTRAPCRLVISLFPRSLAPEVPGFVCSNDCPGALSSRCSAAPPPWALSLAAAPSWAVRTASVAAASSPSRQSLPLRGWCLPHPPPESLERRFPGGGRVGRPGKRRLSACYPNEGFSPAPGSGCPNYQLRPRALPPWQRGAQEQPDNAHPPYMTMLGWEMHFLQVLRFSSQLRCVTPCKTGS